MNRGSEAFQVLKLLLKPTLWALVWMTFYRFLLFTFLYYSSIRFHPDLALAFWAGFRFDLLVLGFFWIPVVAVTWVVAFAIRPRKVFWLWKIYFILVFLYIAGLSLSDFFWISTAGERLNHRVFQSNWLEVLAKGCAQVGEYDCLFVSGWILISAIALCVFTARLPWVEAASQSARMKSVFQALISVFITAFAARGTLTPHHLNIEHAQVSKNSQINQLPLNAIWNLYK